MHNVFVYGTLRNDYKGYMAELLKKEATFEGSGILNNYSLYDLGSFPCVVKQNDSYCKGHIYTSVSDDLLTKLDLYEGYPNHYNRVMENIEKENNENINCFVYTYRKIPVNRVKIMEWIR